MNKKYNSGVVMMHIGRCGSTVLSRMLDQNPAIKFEGEIFLKIFESCNPDIPTLDSFIDNVKQKNPNSLIQLVNIKFLKNQHPSIYNLSIEDMINVFKRKGFDRFIILERKNYLRRMISHCVAQQTNVFFIDNNNNPTLNRINLNINEIKVGNKIYSLLEWFKIFEDGYSDLKRILKNDNYKYLAYEDDIESDPYYAYNQICDYLNISHHKVTCPFNKTNSFPLKDILINYEEVYSLISQTKYKWMLI